MNVYICLDKFNGMLFNSRRQSRDKMIYADVIGDIDDVLYISPFSSNLFSGFERVAVCDDPFSNENAVDVFNETDTLSGKESLTDRLTVYRWACEYPADTYCELDFAKYTLESESVLEGNSHDTILKQIYVRK